MDAHYILSIILERAPKAKLFLRHQPRRVNDNIEMNKVRALFWIDTDHEANYGPIAEMEVRQRG
jgi:hypothetical protein